jgi:hypothetical protein
VLIDTTGLTPKRVKKSELRGGAAYCSFLSLDRRRSKYRNRNTAAAASNKIWFVSTMAAS